jgi:hypothetical protein
MSQPTATAAAVKAPTTAAVAPKAAAKEKPKAKAKPKPKAKVRTAEEEEEEAENKKAPAVKKRPAATRKRKTVPTVEEPTEEDDGDEDGPMADVLEGMRRNEAVLVDTRFNFAYSLPRKARIATNAKEWRQAVSLKGRLTNCYVQVDTNTLNIEGPLELIDIQPVTADNGNFRYLTDAEMDDRLKHGVRTALLGDPLSLATHPTVTGASLDGHPNPTLADEFTNPRPVLEPLYLHPKSKDAHTVTPSPSPSPSRPPPAQRRRATLTGEYIFWVQDKQRRMYPMAIGTFRRLLKQRRMSQPIVLDSPTGWTFFCDEDRTFVLPRDFLPVPATSPLKGGSCGGRTTTENALTPAIRDADAAGEILKRTAEETAAAPSDDAILQGAPDALAAIAAHPSLQSTSS